jgi:hypothetical protein
MSKHPGTDEPTRDEAEADVEGHALPIVAGLGALGRGREKAKGGRKADDAPLPALTKPFPRLKDERPR